MGPLKYVSDEDLDGCNPVQSFWVAKDSNTGETVTLTPQQYNSGDYEEGEQWHTVQN